jgi:C4-dicarboxylate transporter DctQ subunit
VGIAVTLVYLGVVGAFAWLVLTEPYARLTLTPALKLPLWLATLPVPVGFTLMFLRACEIASRMLRGRDPYPGKTAELEAEQAAEREAEGAAGPGRPPDRGASEGPERGDGEADR